MGFSELQGAHFYFSINLGQIARLKGRIKLKTCARRVKFSLRKSILEIDTRIIGRKNVKGCQDAKRQRDAKIRVHTLHKAN